jgi:hypothetical protein
MISIDAHCFPSDAVSDLIIPCLLLDESTKPSQINPSLVPEGQWKPQEQAPTMGFYDDTL